MEEGLRLLGRRKTYDGLLALRGKLQWDDSDAGWARTRSQAQQPVTVQEAKVAYQAKGVSRKVGKSK